VNGAIEMAALRKKVSALKVGINQVLALKKAKSSSFVYECCTFPASVSYESDICKVCHGIEVTLFRDSDNFHLHKRMGKGKGQRRTRTFIGKKKMRRNKGNLKLLKLFLPLSNAKTFPREEKHPGGGEAKRKDKQIRPFSSSFKSFIHSLLERAERKAH